MARVNVKHSGLVLAIGAMLLLTSEVGLAKEMSVDGGGPDRGGSQADRGGRSDRTERTTPTPAATNGSKTEAAAPKPADTKSDGDKAISKGATIAGRFAVGRVIGGAVGGFIAGGPVGAAVGVFLTSSDAK